MRTPAARARSDARSGGRRGALRMSASAREPLDRDAVSCSSSCGHLERYPGPGRLRSVLLVAERHPQLLRQVWDQGSKQLSEQRQRVDQRVAVGSAQLSLARDHPLLEVLDAVEQAHDAAHGAVHLETLHLLGDLLDGGLAPFLKSS